MGSSRSDKGVLFGRKVDRRQVGASGSRLLDIQHVLLATLRPVDLAALLHHPCLFRVAKVDQEIAIRHVKGVQPPWHESGFGTTRCRCGSNTRAGTLATLLPGPRVSGGEAVKALMRVTASSLLEAGTKGVTLAIVGTQTPTCTGNGLLSVRNRSSTELFVRCRWHFTQISLRVDLRSVGEGRTPCHLRSTSS